MFIIAKRGFKFRFHDGSVYKIARDHVGEVPDYVAKHPLFIAAVRGGEIMTPDTHRDADIHRAEEVAAEAFKKTDIRPDAVKAEDEAEAEKPVKKRKRVKE